MTNKQVKKKAVSGKKTISVQELKYWLEGISEFQPDDWIPTAEQWQTIKSKIMTLEDSVSAPAASQHQNRTMAAPQPYFDPNASPYLDVPSHEPMAFKNDLRPPEQRGSPVFKQTDDLSGQPYQTAF
jgi:hypothetical protein